jgi:hypothetical protein
MRDDRRPYLPVRPVFLLTSQLPYDDLLTRVRGGLPGGRMDVLSEVLKVVRLQGAMF